MALTDDFIRNPTRPTLRPGFGAEVFRTIGLSLSALAAGWGAAADYQRLSRMPNHRLRGLGISRDELPHEIHRRHFARLGSRTDCS